jgi:hypothetical protein
MHDEGLMFNRIHDALDAPPPAGAYERLRTVLIKKPVRPRWSPALPTRWSDMGFRLAAGLALVALGAAIASAIVAIHSASINTVPATHRMSVGAYQKMIASDALNPPGVWKDPCDENVHTGCEADAARSIPLVQKWLDDITHASTPARFAVLDAELRQHLTQNIAALNSLIVDSRAHDEAAMTRDYIVAVYAAEWTGTVVPGIVNSQQVDAANYVALVRSETSILDACGAACGFTSPSADCMQGHGITCLYYHDTVAESFAGYQSDITKRAAPDSLATKDARLQGDLSRADSVLLTMRLAVAAGDQVGFNAGIQQLRGILAQLDKDAAAITGG